MTRPARLALVGPTASGKSQLAHAIALAADDIEIVTVDSMQVYRGMDIGTAKPTVAEQAEVSYHVLDVVDPWDDFTVAEYQRVALAAIEEIAARGHRTLLVGGTGLYLRAVVDQLAIPGRWPGVRREVESEPDTAVLHRRLVAGDPVAAARMEPSNRRRIVRALEVTLGSGRPFSSFGPGLDTYPPTPFDIVGVRMPPEHLVARIDRRLHAQLDAGFLDEARRLLRPPPGRTLSRTAGQALGYRELLAHLGGDLTLEEATELAVRRTRHFARRQRAWFRRDPRISWFDVDDEPLSLLTTLTERWN